jgi:hypothetical protein
LLSLLIGRVGLTPGGADNPALGPGEPLTNRLGRPTGHLGKFGRIEAVQVAKDQKRTVFRVEMTLKQIA